MLFMCRAQVLCGYGSREEVEVVDEIGFFRMPSPCADRRLSVGVLTHEKIFND